MSKSSLSPAKEIDEAVEPFGKRGGLSLFWVLARAPEERFEPFSINELSKTLSLSPGTVHRVVSELTRNGIFKSEGLRTSKRYKLKKPDELLILWLKDYKFNKKVKRMQYGVSKPEAFTSQKEDLFLNFATPALHTAARSIYHAGISNLQTVEAYVTQWEKIEQVAKKFALVEQERGYDVLLLKPYYSQIVLNYKQYPDKSLWREAYALLTFLDLYHFPIRGLEQAEALFRKQKGLSSICSWKEIEDANE